MEPGDDFEGISSIGKLKVQFYKDLASMANDPENPLLTVEEAEVAKKTGSDDNPTNIDDVLVVCDRDGIVVDAEGNDYPLDDVAADYDWINNPDHYSGFKIVVKFLMPQFKEATGEMITNPDYMIPDAPTGDQPELPEYRTSPAAKEKDGTKYAFMYWKTGTGVIPPEPDNVIDVRANKWLARALIKTSGDDAAVAEYLLRVYALYEDSLPPTEALKLAAMQMRLAEERLARISVKKFDDEKLVGRPSAGDDIISQLSKAKDDLNKAMLGTETPVTVDLGNGTKETIVNIEYDVGLITLLTHTVTELTEQVAAAGISTQPIGSFLTLNYDPEYGAVIVPDPDNVQKTIVKDPGVEKRAWSVTIVDDGIYEIELWGGSGGHTWAQKGVTYVGGKGAHVKARVALNRGNVLRFYLGGEGGGTATYNDETKEFKKITEGKDAAGNTLIGDAYYQNYIKPGGWNGGGTGGNSRGGNYASGAAGGGATDVRAVVETFDDPLDIYSSVDNNNYTFFGTAPTLDGTALDPKIDGTDAFPDTRILAAGGGGGSAQRAMRTVPALKGGTGGRPQAAGYKGDGTLRVESAVTGAATDTPPVTPTAGLDTDFDNAGSGLYFSVGERYYYTLPPPGGQEAWVSTNSDIQSTTLWQGRNGRNGGNNGGKYEGSGGAGGGYYGGSTMTQNAAGTSSGGGGSNFIASNKYNLNITNLTPGDEDVQGQINQVYGEGHATIQFIE